MIEASKIKADMPVVCSNAGQFAVVDHMVGKDTIQLKKDANGQHHFIPLSWVKSLDGQVHLDRTGEQAMKEWTNTAPVMADAKTADAAKPIKS